MSENNRVTIEGEVLTDPHYLTESFDCTIYEFSVAVERTSGVKDILNVNAPKYLIGDVEKGQTVRIEGEFRSYNKPTDVAGKTKTILSVYAQDIELEPAEEDSNNNIELTGYICKEPRYRKTPFGRDIADVILAVGRETRRSDYIPCIFWGNQAKYICNKCEVGDRVKATGRIQSREYVKVLEDGEKETRVAYEVSVRTFDRVE